MKLKLDEKGNAVLKDGMPVYVHDDGSEVAFDAPGTVATIKRLNGEAKGHREAKEALDAKLKGFAGIEDPAEALAAIETVKNLDAGKLATAEQVAKIKQEAVAAAEAKIAQVTRQKDEALAEVTKDRDALKGQFHETLIGGAFAGSKVVAEKFNIPADIVRKTFGDQFRVEDNKVVAYDKDGNKIGSRQKIGNDAGFDEALEIIVDGYTHKDAILKGRGGGSGGGQGGGGQGGGKTMSRASFSQLTPADQMSKVKDGYTVVD